MSQLTLNTQEESVMCWVEISKDLKQLITNVSELSVDMSRVIALTKKADYLERRLEDLHRLFIDTFCVEDVK